MSLFDKNPAASLMNQYQLAVARHEITDDPLQHAVLTVLQRILDETTRFTWWWPFKKRNVQGLYLHGPVGVGKTYLMDLFFETLAEKRKTRFHFQHFMQQIDAQLRLFQGQKDPIQKIARRISKTTRILCLDEFLVQDVAEAMILAELLKSLFKHHVLLVTTANTKPDDLYWKGLHRDRFLPAIQLIKEHCQVFLLSEDHDYRLGRMPLLQAYITPLDTSTHDRLTQQFKALTGADLGPKEMLIQTRSVSTIAYARRVVWFEFKSLCYLPRCQLDYLEIANRFDTVFVSDIPALGSDDMIGTLLLIQLVDVLYDRGIRFIVSAAVSPSQLCREGPLVSTFQRTLSRLEEMQSEDYLWRHQKRVVKELKENNL